MIRAERIVPKLAINISGVNYNKPYPPKEGAAGLPAPNPARKESATIAAEASGQSGSGASPQAGNTHRRERTSRRLAEQTGAGAGPGSRCRQFRRRCAPSAPVASPQQTTPTATMAPAPSLPPQAPPAAQPAVSQAPAAPSPAPSASVHANAESLQWVGAFQEIQQNTVNAHMAFLSVAEQSMKSLEAMLTGGSAAAPAAQAQPVATPAASSRNRPGDQPGRSACDACGSSAGDFTATDTDAAASAGAADLERDRRCAAAAASNGRSSGPAPHRRD